MKIKLFNVIIYLYVFFKLLFIELWSSMHATDIFITWQSIQPTNHAILSCFSMNAFIMVSYVTFYLQPKHPGNCSWMNTTYYFLSKGAILFACRFNDVIVFESIYLYKCFTKIISSLARRNCRFLSFFFEESR